MTNLHRLSSLAGTTDYNVARKESDAKKLPMIILFVTDPDYHSDRFVKETFGNPHIVSAVNQRFVPLKINYRDENHRSLLATLPSIDFRRSLLQPQMAISHVKVGFQTVESLHKLIAIRFKFQIGSKTALADLLPAQPKSTVKQPPWTNEDLAKVPELSFGEPISKELTRQKSMEAAAHVMAKINHLNGKKTDGFMLAMLEVDAPICVACRS